MHCIVGAVFLDLRKAFDTVNHRILLAKLSSFNLSDKVLKWLKSYLCQRLQTVRIGNSQSEPLPLSTGLPQGSILSPILFCMYINDLPLVCPDVNIQMYSDDKVLYVQGSLKTEVADKLTNVMVKVTTWLNQLCLQLSVSKTVGMFFTKSHKVTKDADILVSREKNTNCQRI